MLHVAARLVGIAFVALISLATSNGHASDDHIANARAAFVAVWPEALEGRWPLDAKQRQLLKDYPLWPDLRAAYFSARLADTDPEALEAFMAKYDDLAPIRRLRYRYAEYLARTRQWSAYMANYQQHYKNTALDRLDCHALNATRAGDNGLDAPAIHELTQRLWRVPHSQDDACDATFAEFLKQGRIDSDDVRARLELAVDARNFGLAGYLAGMLDQSTRDAVSRWRDVANNPKRVLQQAAARASEKHSAEHLLYAANRLAIRDAPATADLWRSVTKRYDIPTTEDHAILRRIGIAAAQDYEPRAAGLLEQVPDQAADERVIEWRARTAMREGRWGDVLRIIAAMPSALSASERWRYWEATALKETGQTEVAEALMAVLATERSYYGFLAADVSGLPYAFDHAELDVSDERLAALANDPQLVRARELFAVDQPARARAEWQRALRGRAAVDKAAAAELAHRWQWHSEAITLLGELQSWDDLDIRYPLAYQDWIAEHAGRASVRSAWVYGITRSESLFTRDIRSSAGAWGLMQLMPATGKRVAREAGITWQGIDTLKDAELNIALGTRYLAYLQDRFSHPALATAAYNAGPHRVQRWLPDTTPMRADVWIETIAYDETRAYVQRVLSADIIFQWRMGEPVQRLADILTPVAPKQSVAQTVTPL